MYYDYYKINFDNISNFEEFKFQKKKLKSNHPKS